MGPLVPPGGFDWRSRLSFVLLGLVVVTVMPLLFSGWWASCYTASALCRDDISEVSFLRMRNFSLYWGVAVALTKCTSMHKCYTTRLSRRLALLILETVRVLTRGKARWKFQYLL